MPRGTARHGASLCKYAEAEGSIDSLEIRLLNCPLPEVWKFFKFFSERKISWEEISWDGAGGNRDNART